MIESNIHRHRKTSAYVDLAKLAENYRNILKAVGGKPEFFCPMVKANAYGHGDVAVSKKLRAIGAKHLGVGLIEEGLHLRLAGDRGEILHFGVFDLEGAREMLANQIVPVVGTRECFEHLVKAAGELSSAKPIEFHLKVNTGMNRLGIAESEVSVMATKISNQSRLKLVGFATLLASGENLGVQGETAAEQLRRFLASEAELLKAGISKPLRHIANSSAAAEISRMTGLQGLGVRPGLALYGASPESKSQGSLGVTPVLSFVSHIAALQDVRQGSRVSYGGTWTAKRDSRIGVVPCGYADGFRRSQKNGSVLVRGHRVPIVGTICMDYFMCDLTEVGSASLDDQVTLIGRDGNESIDASELADRLGTISYEIFTGLSERVPRLYSDEMTT